MLGLTKPLFSVFALYAECSSFPMMATTCCSKKTKKRGVPLNVSTAASTTASTNSSTAATRSFYRRPLPELCTSLSSPEGQALFTSALTNQGLKSFFPLVEQFTTQSEPAYCGISTLVIVLNALAIDPRRTWKGPWRWYEETMLNCCMDLEEIKETGITINDFRCLAMCQGLAADTIFADEETDENGVENLRQYVQRACVKKDEDEKADSESQPQEEVQEFLVVSYSRKVLGQTGSGHFSPIAAYDSSSDSVLILDTARFKYGPHWVKLPLLFEAMKPVDPDTGRSRGYVLLKNHDHAYDDILKNADGTNKTKSPSLTPSVLFRSQRKQIAVRRQYKEYLDNQVEGSPTFDQIISYWTKNGTAPKNIWHMMEPQLTPVENQTEAIELINSVRTLLQELIARETTYEFPETCCDCRVNFSRTLPLLPQEAMFVVFLASIEDDRRIEIVMGKEARKEGEPTAAQTQLLAEAELVRYAIDFSKDTTFIQNE